MKMFFLGQILFVPLLLLGPPFFTLIVLVSTTLLTGMTGISLQMQWPLTSQLHGCFLKESNWLFVTDQTPQVMIFNFFLPKNSAKKLAFFDSNQS
jgi:hypothetical protein